MEITAAQDGRPDVFTIADLLIAPALEMHREEIDIIGYYGSYAQGQATPRSDLDIFYIPAEGKHPPVGRTVLIEGLLFDFWAIPWATMEGFASGNIRGWSFAPAIVAHATILYARSADHVARFTALKQHVHALQQPAARAQMIERALQAFTHVLAHVGNLRLAVAGDDLADARHTGWMVILSVWECLALANQRFVDRGWSNLIEQIPRLPARPANLEQAMIVISTSNDPAAIARAAEQLAITTRQTLRQLQQSLHAEQTAHACFDNSYPEIKDGLRKVLSACERQQPVSASVAAWSIQVEISRMFNALQYSADNPTFNIYSEFASAYRQLGFADLMQVDPSDLALLAERTRLVDQQLRQWLQAHSIELCEFATRAEFARSTPE